MDSELSVTVGFFLQYQTQEDVQETSTCKEDREEKEWKPVGN